MPRPTYKFSEFVDLLLFKLYEADADEGGTGFFNLDQMAKDIKGDVPAEWVFDAAKVLETRALADCVFTFGGTLGKIAGEGRLYVEEGRGFTKKAQESPGNFYVSVTGSNNQVVAGHSATEVKQNTSISSDSQSVKMIEEIVMRLQDDKSLSGPDRLEAVTYANLLKHEITKPEPNRSLVAAVLEPLSQIASIAGNVASFIRLFNAAI